MRRILGIALLLASGIGLCPVAAQTAGTPAVRKTSKPYTGDLSIFESPGREKRLQIERVMDILKIVSGSTVADIGAGSGWFSVRAAKRVGGNGIVYAEDISAEAIEHIHQRAEKEGFSNLRAVLGKADNPMLPGAKINAVLMLKTYHEVAEPVVLLGQLREALAPKARLGIIDRNGNGEDHGVAEKIVVDEAREAGYKLVDRYDFVKADGMDYFLVFEAQ
jgi:ubiquinone/menaquinone biosynthesis C-methylase UbiE